MQMTETKYLDTLRLMGTSLLQNSNLSLIPLMVMHTTAVTAVIHAYHYFGANIKPPNSRGISIIFVFFLRWRTWFGPGGIPWSVLDLYN